METNFLNLYLSNNKRLCKTLNIKSEISADKINEYLILVHGSAMVDLEQPTTWKYYLNISGEYHVTDVPMYVTSLDTLETILFSKENLAIHRHTAEVYEYDSRYYLGLLDQYPDQEQLILGILYPADHEKALAAPNGTILSYPKYLVEVQEDRLIERLQDYIYGYLVRWDVRAFNLSDELYGPAQHMLMYQSIFIKLLNIRLSNCKTNEVHTFHIREYLASNGGLDIYLPYLTLEQSLFLYRNIEYLEHNSGQTEIFRTLIDKLLTARKIPLNEFSVRQLATFNDKLRPNLTVRRKALNIQFNTPEKDYFSTDDMRDKEIPLAYGNQVHMDEHYQNMLRRLERSDSAIVQSKDLESSMLDYSDSMPDSLYDVMLREWAHTALTGHYDAVIPVTDPKTLQTSLLSSKEAFIYFYYLTLTSIGVEVTDLPTYLNFKQRRVVIPTRDELLAVTDEHFTDAGKYADYILLDQPPLVEMRSIYRFNAYGRAVFNEAYKHWYLISGIGDLYERAQVENMVDVLYEIQNISLLPDANDMVSWLSARDLKPGDLAPGDITNLLMTMFDTATGLDNDQTKTLAGIQNAMLSIFRHLNSYSVQVIEEINTRPIQMLNWAAIRTGDYERSSIAYDFIPFGIVIHDIATAGSTDITVKTQLIDNPELVSESSGSLELLTAVDILGDPVYIVDSASYFNAVNISAEYPEYDPAISNTTTFIGLETYFNLTSTEQQSIKSIY